MNKKLTFALALLTSSFVAATADAAPQQRWPNWYVGLHGGLNNRSDGDFRTNTGPTAELSSDPGFIVGASIGYLPPTTVPFFNNSRWEVEFSYRANDNDNGAGGDITSTNYYANLYYDFNNDTSWTPYVGAGIGLSNIEVSNGVLEGDDGQLGWQLMAGLAYEPTTLPNTSWSLGYRYNTTFDDPRFVDDTPPTVAKTEIENHSVELGAKFFF